MASVKSLIRRLIRFAGYELVNAAAAAPFDPLMDLSLSDKRIIATVEPFTMTGQQRLAALLNAIDYLSRYRIPGAVAECGVWKGGSMMAVALKLLELGDTDRDLYLYDTFEGMTPPTSEDISIDGQLAQSQMESAVVEHGAWCQATLEEVKRNLESTGYPTKRIHYVQGRVEDTLPENVPHPLALLRLDTDWYESTRHELNHLFPLLDRRGILIIDDYGHWRGARKAVDEFFATRGMPVYLHRIDYTCRLVVGYEVGPSPA